MRTGVDFIPKVEAEDGQLCMFRTNPSGSRVKVAQLPVCSSLRPAYTQVWVAQTVSAAPVTIL